MTEKDLVQQIRQLKEIKPNQQWVILAKSQLFAEPAKEKIGNWEIGNFFTRKFAYSFAAFIFVAVGLVGFAEYTMPGDLLFPVKKMAEQSTAALSGKTVLKKDALAFNNRINDLAKASVGGNGQNVSSAISEISANAGELAKSLKEDQIKDPETLKEITNSLKVLADVPGTDLSANPEVKDLYQAVVENQIADLEKTTLTDAQKETLIQIKDLYAEGKYTEALEQILTLSF